MGALCVCEGEGGVCVEGVEERGGGSGNRPFKHKARRTELKLSISYSMTSTVSRLSSSSVWSLASKKRFSSHTGLVAPFLVDVRSCAPYILASGARTREHTTGGRCCDLSGAIYSAGLRLRRLV